MNNTFKQWFPWLALFGVLAAVHLTCVSNELGGNLGGDNIVYFLLGKAIATGQGYVDLYLPGHPPHLKYPFLFPLLLAPFHLVFEEPLLYMNAMVALANVIAALALGALVGLRWGSRWLGLLAAASFGAIPVVYLQSLHLLTEPLYCMFCFLALLAMEKSGAEGRAGWTLTAMALGLAAYFTRTAGVALALAAAVVWWREGLRVRMGRFEPRAWLLLAAAFSFLAGFWWLRGRLVGGAGAEYFGEFLLLDPLRPQLGRVGLADLGRRFWANLVFYSPMIGGYAVAPVWATKYVMLGWVAGLASLVGLVREIRSKLRAMEIFYVLSILIVLIWPFQESRFLEPILPLSLYYALRGAVWPARRTPDGGNRELKAAAALGAALLAFEVYLMVGLVSLRLERMSLPPDPVLIEGYGRWSREVVNLAKWDLPTGADVRGDPILLQYGDYLVMNRVASELTPPGAVLVSRKPMLTYYFSGRETLPLLNDPDPLRQWSYFVDRRADFLVAGLSETAWTPMFDQWMDARDGRFEIVAVVQDRSAALVKIHRELAPFGLRTTDPASAPPPR